MNIRKDLIKYLDESGVSPSKLAKEVGLSHMTIYRLLKGEDGNRKGGCHSETINKLEPVLYPSKTS